MVKLPARCELAAWSPVPNFGYGGDIHLDAQAFVVHSAEGHGLPPPRFYDGHSASAHFWNRQDGTLLQLVALTECAWANGQLNRVDGGTNAPALVRGWYQSRTNPNWFTVSMEHEGVAGERLTDAQLRNTENVARWLETHGLRLDYMNLLQHCDISATACPSGRVPVGRILTEIHAPASSAPEAPDMTEDQVRAIVRDEFTKLWTAGAPPLFRHYVQLAVDPEPGGFTDHDGNLLPSVLPEKLTELAK